MPTICELQIEAKKKGLRGYSKLKKNELEEFVKKEAPKKAAPKKAAPKKEAPKKETKPPAPKRLGYNNVATSGTEYREMLERRKRLEPRVQHFIRVMNDKAATEAEKRNAKILYDKISGELEEVKKKIRILKPQYDSELKFKKNNKKK